MTIVQVGTNKAIDSCQEFVKQNKDKIKNVYLIEPLSYYNSIIDSKYSFFSDVQIFNIAIVPTTEKSTIEIFHTKDLNRGGAHSSTSLNHLHAHKHNPSLIQSTQVSCMTLNDFFRKNSINTCDRLYIDTEGMDCDILTSFELNSFDVKYIEFEYIHSDGPFKTGEKFENCKKFLIEHNYSVSQIDKLNCVAKKCS